MGGLKVDGAALPVTPCPHEEDEEGCVEHRCMEVPQVLLLNC